MLTVAEHRSIWQCSICGGPIYGDAHVHGLCAGKVVAERDEAMKLLGKAVGGQGKAVTAVLALRRQLAECRAAREGAEAEAANLYKQRIDAKLRAERLMAEAGVMRKTLEEIAASTAGDDEPGDRSPRRAGWECVQRARAVLASGAGEKAAAVLEAGRRLLAARSWDVMGEEFLALKAAFDTLDADHG